MQRHNRTYVKIEGTFRGRTAVLSRFARLARKERPTINKGKNDLAKVTAITDTVGSHG